MSEFKKALQDRFLLQEEYLGDEKPINKIIPLVSVTVATYQHVNYIKDCLNGILMQKTDFSYEIVLGEDGSSDGTQEICKEYAEKYPDKIRLFIRDRNLSQFVNEDGSTSRFNGLWNRMSARGKYIAWCEGDDYWIDPLKLQKQVDFLETHSDYTMCFHNAFVYYVQQHTVKLFNDFTSNCDLSMHDAIHNWFVPTASILVRKEICFPPNWLARIYCGDYPLIIYARYKGKVRCFHDIMSVYRVNTIGVSATAQVLKRIIFVSEQKLLLLRSFDNGTNLKYHKDIESKVKELEREIKFQKIKYDKNPFKIVLNVDVVLNRIWIKIKMCYDKLRS